MRGRSVYELQRDYEDTLKRAKELPPELRKPLHDYERFLRRNSHHLQEWPESLFTLAASQPKDSRVWADTEGRRGPSPRTCPRDKIGQPPERRLPH